MKWQAKKRQHDNPFFKKDQLHEYDASKMYIEMSD